MERGIPAVAFAVSGCIGASNRWDQAAGAATLPLLDVPGLEALARSGLEIGGHSRTHRSLVEVDAAELAGETAGVAADLERAGLAAPRLFARLLLRRFGRQSAALAPLAAALASLADTPGGLLGLAA